LNPQGSFVKFPLLHRFLLTQALPGAHEFQDTDDDQWRIVHALAPITNIFCLADPEQRIFEYRKNVDPQRLNLLRRIVSPIEFDLGGENHRSAAASGILRVANSVLRNQFPLPSTPDVKHLSYPPKAFDKVAHAAVVWTLHSLRDKGIKNPCVSVLCRTNSFVAKLSAILSEEHVMNERRIAPIDHDVVWDADLSAASAVVVGSILEWTSKPRNEAVATTLNAISNYYRLKNANHPSGLAAKNAHQYAEAATTLIKGARPRIKAAKELIDFFDSDMPFTGNPIEDWKMARQPLHDTAALLEIFREVRLVRLFRASDTLAAGLAELWLETVSYAGAVNLVKRVLDRERLIAADRDPEGCILMTIHKSKGKEFDGVVLIEGQFESPFFSPRESPPFEQSRRLLRVAITRAKSLVTIVRPHRAQPLVG
jgi:DNA helicase-2/ATP-dependent DNA helicase PcrA